MPVPGRRALRAGAGGWWLGTSSMTSWRQVMLVVLVLVTAVANCYTNTPLAAAALATAASAQGDHHVAAAGGVSCSGEQAREVFGRCRVVDTPECAVAAAQPAGEDKWCDCAASASFQACAGDTGGCGQQILDALCEIELERECPDGLGVKRCGDPGTPPTPGTAPRPASISSNIPIIFFIHLVPIPGAHRTLRSAACLVDAGGVRWGSMWLCPRSRRWPNCRGLCLCAP